MAQELISDASTTFIGGQDASKTPHLVPQDAYFAGVNVSVEDGVLKSRWGLEKLKNTFPTGGIARENSLIKEFSAVFHSGKFQALTTYSIASTYYLVAVISGQIFFINEKTFAVQHIPLEGEQLNAHADRLNTSPAGRYLVIFDYPAYPVIIDGSTARRADPTKDEIPVSNIGAYNQNRLFIGNIGNEFTAGDPAGSTATPDAPITFTEVIEPNTGFTGQVFQLSTNYNNDPITAFTFLQTADTGTGIGPFLAATKQAIYSYNTQQPRSQWAPENLSAVFGSLFVYNAGIVGPLAVDHLNSDLIFMSADGQVRSLAMSRQEQGKWSKTPISKEVRNWLINSDPELLQYSFVTYFKNKVFISANPYRTTASGIDNEALPDYAFGGLAVLELDNISTLTKESNPAWAGLWTGVRPMACVVCNDRCFIMSKDGQANVLYELRPDLSYDKDEDKIRPIQSRIQTREYDFGDSFFLNKQLHSIDLKLKRIRGDLKAVVKFKPDHAESFLPWRTFEHKAPWRICRKPFVFNGYEPHSFLNVNLGSPKDIARSCNPVTKVQNQTFRHLQLELIIEGISWELEGLRIKAVLDRQSENIDSCPTGRAVAVPAQCTDYWSYEGFTSCQERQTQS